METPASPDLPAADLADILLLWSAAHRSAVHLLPRGSAHQISFEGGGETESFSVPAATGDATVARLALVAGLDPSSPDEQLGRIRLRAGRVQADLLVVMTVREDGIGAEIRRIADPESQQTGPLAAGAMALRPDAGSMQRVGSYRVTRELGRGGVGIVLLGEHEMIGTRVAIKLLHPHFARSPEIAARFVREGRAAARIKHPGVVAVLDYGVTAGGAAFLVMELVEWPTLAAVLAREKALPPARALAVARGIGLALEAAHSSGVVHRDLKPANVFVGPDDAVKLGDFGAAKALDQPWVNVADSQTDSVYGTPVYMSPEHARGLSVDGRTDVYALGCMLYEMLSGRLPFDGGTARDVMLKHISDPAPPLTSPDGTAPEALVRVVHRAMAKRLDDRFASAADMVRELDRATLALTRTGWRRWLPSR